MCLFGISNIWQMWLLCWYCSELGMLGASWVWFNTCVWQLRWLYIGSHLHRYVHLLLILPVI